MSEEQESAASTAEDQSEIHACMDAVLPLEMDEEAKRLAIEENPDNADKGREVDLGGDQRAFVVTGKLWKPGRTLRVRFMGGTPDVHEKVKQYAGEWSKCTSIKFDFNNANDAEIRIAFVKDGSWSYIGTDALARPKDQPTMNYGWFDKPVPEDEYSRVIVHEFGHALGMPHEHNHPKATISWDKEAVYRYYMGPPNNWNKEQVDNNLFAKYSTTLTQFSKFDTESIMLYPIPRRFVTNPADAVPWSNTKLSATDKSFMRKIYP